MTAEKTSQPAVTQHHSAAGTFFRKAEGEGFFGPKEPNSFFGNNFIQPKLSVSQPNDPQEKEADAVADQVMRMPEPAAGAGSIQKEDTTSLMRMPDAAGIPVSAPEEKEKLNRMEDEEGADGGVQAKLMRKCADCEKKEDGVKAKLMRLPINASTEEEQTNFSTEESAGESQQIQAKAHGPPSLIIQRSGRAPPLPSSNFESSLQSTKGGGSPLPADNRQSLESRFGADFSSVRIHTDTQAQNLSSGIQAHAFTHGGDIYFNSGKYSPDTSEGGHLLAHELTHTIQQGASSTSNNAARTAISRKSSGTFNPQPIGIRPSIQRVAAERPVPSQLNDAVGKAKSEVGKVNAGKAGDDGFRMGWERLSEYFKTTLGEDKVIGNGGTYVKGAVSEQDIKKKRQVSALPPAHPDIADKGNYKHDAMPSWCGIFVFWALHKAGVPMKPWGLGAQNIKPDAAYPPGYIPKAGDIAYRNNFSHFAIVEKATAETITTVNGNTAGEDNLGGQVQVRDHPRSDWTAFFDPLMLKDGPLTSGETTAEAVVPLGVDELRKKLFRKEDAGEELEHHEAESAVGAEIQAKQDLSPYSVNSQGILQRNATSVETDESLQKKDEEQNEEEKAGGSKEGIVQKKAANSHEDTGADAENENAELVAEAPLGTDSIQRKINIGEQNSINVAPSLPLSRGPPGRIQRSWLGDAWDAVGDAVSGAIEWAEDQINEAKEWILQQASDFVSAIPGFRLLTVILQRNPITGRTVARDGANLLEAGLDILPLGSVFRQVLIRTGTYGEAANFILGRVNEFVNMAANIGTRFSRFIDSLSLSDIGHPQQVLQNVASLLHDVIMEVVGFITRSAEDFIEMIKRIMIGLVGNFIRSRIPRLYPLLRVALGHDPITNEDVPRNGANILNALFEVTDEGRAQRARLQENGAFEKVAAWIDRGISVFTNLYQAIRTGFTAIWDFISIDSLAHPREAFERIYSHFVQPVLAVWKFVKDAALVIVQFIKDAILSRLSTWAKGQRGYFLITLLIHRDPFTDKSVPFTVENVIHAFMSLMDGGEEQFQQMKESGAIGRATNQINAALRRLNFTVEYIVSLFTTVWESIHLSDLANLPALFRRVIQAFAAPVRRLVSFVVEIIKIVVQVILQIMKFPIGLLQTIIEQVIEAIELIRQDPIGFLKNLIGALKQGFVQFFAHIVRHLLAGLRVFLMRELQAAGIPIPTDFSIPGIIRWLMELLDITIEKMWEKLANRIGKEKVAKARALIAKGEALVGQAQEAWRIFNDIRTNGISAVVKMIQEKLSNIWDTVVDTVKNFIMEKVVAFATKKLLAFLDFTGIMPAINAAIMLFNAIQSFLKYIQQMLEMLNRFLTGVIAIATGNLAPAANKLEGALADGIPIAIGFLANQANINLADRMKSILEGVRKKVDEGLDWLVDKLVGLVEKLIKKGKQAVRKLIGWWKAKKVINLPGGIKHTLYFEGSNERAVLTMRSTPMPYERFIDDFKKSLQDDKARQEKVPAIEAALKKNQDLEKEKAKNFDSLPEAEKEVALEKQNVAVEALVNELGELSKALFMSADESAGGVLGFLAKNENRNAVKMGDKIAMRKMLEIGKVWRDTVETLQGDQKKNPDNKAVMISMLKFRGEIVADLAKEPFKMKISGDKPSTQPISDVDMITTGNDAGKKLIEAEKFMRSAYGSNWTPMLRMNFYTDASRLVAYTTIQKLLSPDEFATWQLIVTGHSEVLIYAKMLQHAHGDVERLAQVNAMMDHVTPFVKRLAEKFAAETPASAQKRLREVHTAIDALSARQQSADIPKEEKIQNAKDITILQMEANFRTEEAYIGPGAGRHVVQSVAVVGHEAYQSALGNMEMIEHTIHANGGVKPALMQYEIYKYIHRFITATMTGGLPTSPLFLQYFQTSADIYSSEPGKREQLQKFDKRNAEFIYMLYNGFVKEAAEALRILKEEASANSVSWTEKEKTLRVDLGPKNYILYSPNYGRFLNLRTVKTK